MANQPSALYTKIKDTATAFIACYDRSVVNKDVKVLSETLSPDCMRYYAPASMVAQVPAFAAGETNQQYEDHMVLEVTQVFTKSSCSVKELVVDEYARKASVLSLHACSTPSGQEYEFEFSWTLHMSEDGGSIVRVIEFVDTGLAAKFLADQKHVAESLQGHVFQHRQA